MCTQLQLILCNSGSAYGLDRTGLHLRLSDRRTDRLKFRGTSRIDFNKS